ncbi:ankyrin repeat domain-containing protein 39-like isoform X2 [Patiria miniata]|uniref:Ankyrin repeat domain-containing protein 39 n=1 Tax=Patiria miniata TaxID=46514 RepID=A0A913ZDZ3_PATMI|nr:ankyrin repeat domain-containing protein 39-like isoform X2 [Patiria miniata]
MLCPYKNILAMATHRDDHQCCNHTHQSPATQTLDELDFERGVWSAALNGETQKVRKFLDNGGDPNATDSSGYTALHYASRNGQLEIVRILLQHRANPNCATRSGGVTPLHRAAYSGHLDVVKLLLDRKASPSLRDQDGKCSLHKGAERGHLDICKLLVAADSSLVSLQDNRGRRPVDYVPESNVPLRELLKDR